MPKFIDRTGQTFGDWEVLRRAPNAGVQTCWWCKCHASGCGSEVIVRAADLSSGKSTCCGCKAHTQKGLSTTRTYQIWSIMRHRCENTKNIVYENYGGRGIKVCGRWQKFSNFREDMGDPAEGMILDRVDGSKGYELENCRWATMAEQQRNRGDNINIEYNGETHCAADWATIVGLCPTTVYKRLYRGWPAEKVLSLPAGATRSWKRGPRGPYKKKTA